MPSNFDVNRAYELANLIDAAYDQFDALREKKVWPPASSGILNTEDGNYKILSIHQTKSPYNPIDFPNQVVPFGFIAMRENTIFVVFRGTRTPLEWFRDAEIKQVPYLPGWGNTTSGFNKIYQQLSKQVIDTLKNKEKCPPNAKVFVTGHSLGGALASLCVPDILSKTDFKNPALYTFACPRTGNKEFAQAYRKSGLNCFRIANSEDIVTTLPLSTPILEVQQEGLAYKLSSPTLKNAIKSLSNLTIFEHIGQPIYFTLQKDTIADNHNLKDTYRKGIKTLIS